MLDWFSLAEPPAADAATRALPVVGEPGDVPPMPSDDPEVPAPSAGVPAASTPPPGLPAWSPPFVAAQPSAPAERVNPIEPPVGEAAGAAEPPPGPVTPTGPFALRWGSNEPAAGASGDAVEPPLPTPPSAATTPDSAPRGWDERVAQPARPAPYDDELWSALNEPEAEPEPEEQRSDDSPSTPATPTHPGVALNLPVVPPPGAQPPPAAPAPFPAFASGESAESGEPTEPQGGEQIDDLLTELGNRWAAREAGADAAPADQTAPKEPNADTFDAPGDAEPAAEPSPGEPGETHSPIAKQVAEAGYFWNLTPDPTAADPVADVSGTAATINRLRATSSESESEVDAEFEPEAPSPSPSPSPNSNCSPAPNPTPTTPTCRSGAPSRLPSRTSAPGHPIVANPPPGPTITIRSPRSSVVSRRRRHRRRPARRRRSPTRSPTWRPPLPATPTAAPAGVATPARSAYDVASTASGGGSGGSGTTGSGTPGRRNSPGRVLAWIAGGLAAVLVLTGLFWLGTQLGGGMAAPAESPVASPTPTPTPEPTAAQPAGVHAWDSLFGGECIEPFAGPWAEEFTVVDCATPHAAQLVYRGVLPGDAAAPFPGEAELAAQMNVLCTATGVINIPTVAGIEDLQVQASFPVTEEQWAEGERNYYCFANRAGGEPLTASIAGPGPPPDMAVERGALVVVGSLNVDSTSYVARFPEPGETVTAHGFVVALGGKGSNQAVAAHVAGAAVELVARVGDDASGDFALAALGRFGLPLGAVERVTDVPTGVAQITVADTGENAVIVTPGANAELTPAVSTPSKTASRPRASCSPRASCPSPPSSGSPGSRRPRACDSC